MANLNDIQKEILKALEQLGERAMYPETILAKKIRSNTKFTGKPKAVIALNDLETVISFMEEQGSAHYSLHLNSANDLLIKKDEKTKLLEGDARRRRQQSEKSSTIYTNSDFIQKGGGSSNRSSAKKPQKRTERRSLNTNCDFDELY